MTEVKDSILYVILIERMMKKSADSFRTLVKPEFENCLAEHEFYQIIYRDFHLSRKIARKLFFELRDMGIITPMKRGFKINIDAISKLVENIGKNNVKRRTDGFISIYDSIYLWIIKMQQNLGLLPSLEV